jgi:hypothetical protein
MRKLKTFSTGLVGFRKPSGEQSEKIRTIVTELAKQITDFTGGVLPTPPVTVIPSWECLTLTAKGPLGSKTDSSVPPADASAIQAVVCT